MSIRVSILPDDIHEHVDYNWGSSGLAGAEYVYGILSQAVRVLEDEVDSLRYEQDSVYELRARVQDALRTLTSQITSS